MRKTMLVVAAAILILTLYSCSIIGNKSASESTGENQEQTYDYNDGNSEIVFKIKDPKYPGSRTIPVNSDKIHLYLKEYDHSFKLLLSKNFTGESEYLTFTLRIPADNYYVAAVAVEDNDTLLSYGWATVTILPNQSTKVTLDLTPLITSLELIDYDSKEFDDPYGSETVFLNAILDWRVVSEGFAEFYDKFMVEYNSGYGDYVYNLYQVDSWKDATGTIENWWGSWDDCCVSQMRWFDNKADQIYRYDPYINGGYYDDHNFFFHTTNDGTAYTYLIISIPYLYPDGSEYEYDSGIIYSYIPMRFGYDASYYKPVYLRTIIDMKNNAFFGDIEVEIK